MKSQQILDGLNDIDPLILREAEPGQKRKKAPVRFILLAAALIVVLAAAVAVGAFYGKSGEPQIGEDNAAGQTENAGTGQPETKDNNAVLPAENGGESSPDVQQIPAARVYLDVNPGFSLDLSEGGKLLAVNAENKDAKKICADSETPESLEAAFDLLLDKMAEGGYLTEKNDTLLISVECADGARAKELKGQAVDCAQRFLSARLPSGRVISQYLTENKTSASIAKKYGISRGAATFLLRLIGIDEGLTEEKLAKMTVTQLRQLCEQYGVSTESIFMYSLREAVAIATAEFEKQTAALESETGAEVCGVVTNFIRGYAVSGSTGVWRIGMSGPVFLAVYDVNCETGELTETDRRPALDNGGILAAAIAGLGYTEEQIYHYEVYADRNFSMGMIRPLTIYDPERRAEVFARGIDLTSDVVYSVTLRPLDSDTYLEVCVNGCSGEIVSTKKMIYASYATDAAITAVADAGYGDLPLDKYASIGMSVSMVGGLGTTVRFSVDGVRYEYLIDNQTGEILSKTVTEN